MHKIEIRYFRAAQILKIIIHETKQIIAELNQFPIE